MSADGQEKEASSNGGCEGPDSIYLKIISSDGHEFILKREHALMSGTITTMLRGPGQFSESETNEIHLTEIPSCVLHIVCLYLMYKHRYKNTPYEIPVFHIPQNMAFDVLMAANFLNC